MLVCVFYVHFARETAGAARTRLSLRPLLARRVKDDANLGRIAPRDRGSVSTHNVGPATAGTHTHRPVLLRESLRRVRRSFSEGGTASPKTSDTAYGSRRSPGRRAEIAVLPKLILPPLKPRRHLPIFHQPPRRDREDAAVWVAVPVGHALVGPHHARVHGVDLAVVVFVDFRLALDRAVAAFQKLAQRQHHVADAAFGHENLVAAMGQTRVRTRQHEKVRKAGNG